MCMNGWISEALIVQRVRGLCLLSLYHGQVSISALCLKMGGRGHPLPVGGEGLPGPSEGQVGPRPDDRNAERRPGQPKGGDLLPEEEP